MKNLKSEKVKKLQNSEVSLLEDGASPRIRERKDAFFPLQRLESQRKFPALTPIARFLVGGDDFFT